LFPGRCQASVSPQSSESYSESEGQSSESENSTATRLARMVATSDKPCPFPFSCASLASTFFKAIPSLIAFRRSDLTSSSGFLTLGGGFFSWGGEVIVDIFFGDEDALGREPLALYTPFSDGGGGGGGGGGAGARAVGAGGGGGEGARLSGTGGGGGKQSGSGLWRGELGCCAKTLDRSATRGPLRVMADISLAGGGGGGGRLSLPALLALMFLVGVPSPWPALVGGGAGGG